MYKRQKKTYQKFTLLILKQVLTLHVIFWQINNITLECDHVMLRSHMIISRTLPRPLSFIHVLVIFTRIYYWKIFVSLNHLPLPIWKSSRGFLWKYGRACQNLHHSHPIRLHVWSVKMRHIVLHGKVLL